MQQLSTAIVFVLVRFNGLRLFFDFAGFRADLGIE